MSSPDIYVAPYNGNGRKNWQNVRAAPFRKRGARSEARMRPETEYPARYPTIQRLREVFGRHYFRSGWIRSCHRSARWLARKWLRG